MNNDDVTNYIDSFEGVTRARLQKLRELAHANIPHANEKISYGVPTICDEKGKYIAYFAGYDEFVSIYPVHLAEPVDGIDKHLYGKSTARFKHNEPLPEKMINKLFANLLLSYNSRKK
jgi:uncharacterized protein YdhG (YjbR/CyaY superfamily)